MIAVTGGAGFIGSAIIWALNQKGIRDILIIDELGNDDKWKNLVNLDFYDYVDKNDFLMNLDEGHYDNVFTGIIHMGACSSTTEKDADFLMQNNYKYTLALCTWCLENDIQFSDLLLILQYLRV